MKCAPLVLAALLGLFIFSSPADAQCPNGGGSSGSDGSDSGGSSAGSGAGTEAGSGSATSSGARSASRSGRRSGRAHVTAAGSPTTSTGGSGVRGTSGRNGPTTGGGSPLSIGCSLAGRELDSWGTWWARNQDAFLWDADPLQASMNASAKPATPMTAAGRGLTRSGRSSRTEGTDTRPARSTIYTAIVPSLLDLVRTSDDPRVVDAAVRALGATVEAPFQDPISEALLPLLSDDSDQVRLSATLALGLLGDTESATLLELATCSTAGHALVGETSVPPRMRAAATLALGYADDPRSVASLIDMVERLPDSEADTKRSAIHALGIMRNPQSGIAVDYLMSKVHDERMEPTIRSAIPTALGRHGRAETVQTLLAVLEDRDTDRRVKQSVVIGLGQLAGPQHADVVDVLMEVIEDSSDSATRHFAFMSLAAVGGRNAVAGSHAPVHEAITKFLGKELTKPRRSLDRPWAALSAGIYVRRNPGQRAQLAPRMIDAYQDVKDPTLRGAFALGLGLGGVHGAADELLVDFRRTGDEELRGYLALALGFMGETSATEDLQFALERKGSGPALRRSVGLACRLLGDIGTSAASASIAVHYEDEASLDGRLGLSQALAALQHRDGVGPLTRAAADETLDSVSRASACAALGRVAEKSTAPWQAALRMDSNYMVDAGVSMDQLLGIH